MVCISGKDDGDETKLGSEPRLLFVPWNCLTVCNGVSLQDYVWILCLLLESISSDEENPRTPKLGHQLIVRVVLPERLISL